MSSTISPGRFEGKGQERPRRASVSRESVKQIQEGRGRGVSPTEDTEDTEDTEERIRRERQDKESRKLRKGGRGVGKREGEKKHNGGHGGGRHDASGSEAPKNLDLERSFCPLPLALPLPLPMPFSVRSGKQGRQGGKGVAPSPPAFLVFSLPSCVSPGAGPRVSASAPGSGEGSRRAARDRPPGGPGARPGCGSGATRSP